METSSLKLHASTLRVVMDINLKTCSQRITNFLGECRWPKGTRSHLEIERDQLP